MNLNGLPPVIRLQDLTKVFSTEEVETHALSNVSVQIERGEYVSIAGPSGCGKSTLLSILGLLDSPTQGSYELCWIAFRSWRRRTSIRISCPVAGSNWWGSLGPS
jgi:ABC-type lipoprotein export system ATPase subunit